VTPAKRYVLGIDQGTTQTKVIVVDAEGRLQGTASTEFTQIFAQPGWVEHDPEVIWRSVRDMIDAALHDAGAEVTELVALGITNQRETVVLWDRRSGTPVYNAIVWQDRRTAGECEDLRKLGVGELVHSRSGLRLDPYFSATKITWILDHVEGLRARAERGEIACGTVDSWLTWKLTGGRVHATDVTNASRTMLMDLPTGTWDEDLCRLFHVPIDVLASIRPSGSIFGETDQTVFGASVPIGSLIGDQQAALFAQNCVAPGQTKSTYGTGSFVLQHTGDNALLDASSMVATAAFTNSDQPYQFALEGSIFVTGAALQWLRDGLGIIESAEESEELARGLDDNGDVWFVPALTGLGAPTWDPLARGMMIGMTRGTTRAHLVRAALESIAYHTKDVIDVMNSESGLHLHELLVDGGATRNRWLMQFQSDILGVPVIVASSSHTTALGAVFAAGITGGMWRHGDVPDLTQEGVRYEPAMTDAQRESLHHRWTLALERAQGWAQ
jgi:glycerol kinase